MHEALLASEDARDAAVEKSDMNAIISKAVADGIIPATYLETVTKVVVESGAINAADYSYLYKRFEEIDLSNAKVNGFASAQGSGKIDYKQNCLPYKAFFSDKKIKSLTLPNTLIIVGYNALDSSSVEKCILPDGLQALNFGCIKSATSLKEINIPASVNSIGNSVLISCSKLDKIVLNWGADATVSIPKLATTFPAEYKTGAAKSFTIPAGMTGKGVYETLATVYNVKEAE